MTKLSDAAPTILTAASQRIRHLAIPPERLPVAAQRSVTHDRLDLVAAFEPLRSALTHQVGSAALRQPRPDTKRAAILTMLQRPGGATVAQVVEATGWARYTVHGFFAGLKKTGTRVEVLDQVRQAGPGKQGAAGSYTVYHVGEAG